jgi:hypothetical protein
MLGESKIGYTHSKSQTEEQRYGGDPKPHSNVGKNAPKARYEGMGFNHPGSKRINASTKSSDSESSEEKKVVQNQKQIIITDEKIIKVRDGNESFISNESDPNHISLILKDEYFDKVEEDQSVEASDLIKNNVTASESALTRFCRKFITFESHQSGKKVAFYTIPQVMVWINALLVKVFVVIIPFVTGTAITLALSASIVTGIAAGGIALGVFILVLSAKNDEGKRLIKLPFFNKQIPARRTAVIVAALAFLGTAVTIGVTLGLMAGLTAGGALLGGMVLLIFLKKTIFAPAELKEKFLHINKLPLDDKDPEKLAKYKSALRWARIPLLVHSLLFNVKSLRGQFISKTQCSNDPQTFTTTGVVVIPDEIAERIVGKTEKGSFKAWFSRHCPLFSTLATMRFINFAMTLLVLSSLVCTILVIAGVGIGPLSALAIPMALEAMGGSAAGISAFLLANHWASIVFFSLILACYLPTFYRTIRDNEFDRELSDLKSIKKADSPLNQEWLNNNRGAKVRIQILTRKKILATIYFELTKKRIYEKSLENLSASELKSMIDFEYLNQIKSNKQQTASMDKSKLTKQLIALKAKALKDTFHSFQYLKQEGLARLRYETEYNRKIAIINAKLQTLNQEATPKDLISTFQDIPEVKEIMQGYRDFGVKRIFEDQKLSFSEKIRMLKEIIKTDADYIINEKTEERVNLMKGSFMGESTLKKKENKAQDEFEALTKEIKELPEYNLGIFTESLQDLSKEELRETLNDEIENQPHANESDVIARLSLHRATAWYLSENGGWNNRRNNAADIKENTLQKIVNTLVSECNQLNDGTLNYKKQAIKARHEEIERQDQREQKRKDEADKSKLMANRSSSKASQITKKSRV